MRFVTYSALPVQLHEIMCINSYVHWVCSGNMLYMLHNIV